MEFQDLLTLIDKLDKSTLTFLDYKRDNNHVILSKNAVNESVSQAKAEAVHNHLQQNEKVEVVQEKAPETEQLTEALREELTGEVVTSPMVGVVYLQANPDADPYIQVGERVEQGDVICIIEAMKLMNEIQAPKSGIIEEILVENESVVEFGQAIVRIK